uniref:ORF2 n=1 Tax=Torque teno virus TaxID=68887 RepID=Q9WSW8_9VIRU|nr:ORF2 [Torque teno virus]
MGKALKKDMFLGKLYRKKRRLSLSSLHTPQKARKLLSDMWRPPVHNVQGQERQWYESCFRSHAAMCGCGDFIRHLCSLADNFGRPATVPRPPAPPPPVRPLPALPAPPNPSGSRAQWPTGGGDVEDEPRGGGDGAGGFADLADEELLTAAAELAEE